MEDDSLLWDGKPALHWIENLLHPDGDQRLRAVDALRHIARPSQTVPSFLRVLEDRDWRVRALAVHSFYDMAHDEGVLELLTEAIPALTTALSDECEEVRLNAVYTLELLGPRAKAALPRLSEVFESGNDRLRQATSDAILALKRSPI
jgi:HEAT repeat protein